MDLASKLSSQYVRVVILCLMTVRIVVTGPDDLWWEKYNEPGDYDQLMQEEITGKRNLHCMGR